jgi:replicative DNA helicase
MMATIHNIAGKRDDTRRTVPQSVEAERGIIGAAVEQQVRGRGEAPTVMAQVGGAALVDDFFHADLRQIWSLLVERDAAHLPCDSVSVFEALRQRGITLSNVRQSDLLSWAVDFQEIYAGFPSLADYYAQQIRDAAARRRAIVHAQELIRRLEGEDKRPLSDWYAEAVRPLSDVSVPTATTDGLGPHVERVMRRVGSLLETGRLQRPGLPTGITGIDKLLGGLRPGHLVVIGARPSVGKSALGIGIAISIARQVGPVAFISAEMPAEEYVERILSQTSGVELTRIWRGPLTPKEHRPLVGAAQIASGLPIHVDDDVRDWPAVLGRMQQRVAQGCRAVVVDYLGLMRVPGNDPSWEKIAQVTHDAKDFAKRHKVPVIVLSQVNRQGADPKRPPTMAELRGSGDIEQDADVILLIHRPHAYDPENDDGNADIVIEKHRGGPTGTVSVRWNKHTAEFADLDAIQFADMGADDGRYGR